MARHPLSAQAVHVPLVYVPSLSEGAESSHLSCLGPGHLGLLNV